jgi:peptidase M15-like protein
MPITSTLRHFALTEFRHPEIVQNDAAVWLDDIRDTCGFPLVLTSDARTQAENDAASGSSPTSLHLQGRAFDLRYPKTAEDVWRFVDAVFLASGERPVELELVNSSQDKHLHIALLPTGKTSRLIVRAD